MTSSSLHLRPSPLPQRELVPYLFYSDSELVVTAKAVLPANVQPKDPRAGMYSKAGSWAVRRSLFLVSTETSEGKGDGRDERDARTVDKNLCEPMVFGEMGVRMPLTLTTKEPQSVAPAKDVLSIASIVQPAVAHESINTATGKQSKSGARGDVDQDAQDDGTSSPEARVTIAPANRAGNNTDKAAETTQSAALDLPAAALARKQTKHEWVVAMGRSTAGKARDSTHRVEDQALRTCHLCNQKSGHMRRHLQQGHQLCNAEIDELLIQWKQMAAGPANPKVLICPYCRTVQTRLKRHLQTIHRLTDPVLIKDRLIAPALSRPQTAGESDGRPMDLFNSVMTGFEAFLFSRAGYVYKASIAKDLVQKVKTILSFIVLPSVFNFGSLREMQRCTVETKMAF